jgi:hypothetical protein
MALGLGASTLSATSRIDPSSSRQAHPSNSQGCLKDSVQNKPKHAVGLQPAVEMVTSRRVTLHAVIARRQSAIGGDDMCSRTRLAGVHQTVRSHRSSGKHSLDAP